MKEPGIPPVLGIIGGTGLYGVKELINPTWVKVDTPFGPPSDELLQGTIEDITVVFLPRHGRHHTIPPHQINYRANIHALKQRGVTEILSVSAVGSFEESLKPGTFLIVDQFIDRTRGRVGSFFEQGLVAHIPFGEPTCSRLRTTLEATLTQLALPYVNKGTYLVMEGPQFSTRAESLLYRSWGCQVIGMTNMPEAKLAREAEICYITLAMITDYDSWHSQYENVNVAQVIQIVENNANKARFLIKNFAPMMADRKQRCPVGCHTVLDNALVTHPDHISPEMSEKVEILIHRALREREARGTL